MTLTDKRKYRNKKIKQKEKILGIITGRTREENRLAGLDILLWYFLNQHKFETIGKRYEKINNFTSAGNNICV